VGAVLQLPVLEMLLERGASLDAKTRNGDTALGKVIFVVLFYFHGKTWGHYNQKLYR